jgi:hypothetical protein
LTGGLGHDTFRFSWGDSPATFAGSDIITDFNTHEDKIDFWFAYPDATSSNYLEFAGGARTDNLEVNFNDMRRAAQDYINDNHNLQYVFGTNGKDGYLFADLDHNGTIDTGVELRGLNSTGDFSRFNIFNPSHPGFDDLSHDLSHLNLVV